MCVYSVSRETCRRWSKIRLAEAEAQHQDYDDGYQRRESGRWLAYEEITVCAEEFALVPDIVFTLKLVWLMCCVVFEQLISNCSYASLPVGRGSSPTSRERWCGQWFWHRGGGYWSGEQVWKFTWFLRNRTVEKEKLFLFCKTLCLQREENLAKIARRVKDYKVEELNPPREGKRLLVLDVDYTLFGELLM